MAQDLASLVIGLRADVAQLQNDLGKANYLNNKYAKEASEIWNRAASDIANKLVGILTVDKLVEFGRQVIDTADNFNKMSQKVGISVESLSALNVQAKLADVATDQLQGGLAKLARNAADAAAGGKQNAAAFAAMGVSLKDSNGNLKSTQDILQAVATKFAQYGDSAEKTALAQQLFGKSGAELIPLLNQLGAQGFAKAREEAEKYGAVISTDTAQQAEAFNDNLTRLKLETEGFANAVASQLLPGLVKLSQAMVDAGTTTDRYGGIATTAAGAIKSFVLALIAAKEFISSLITVVLALGDVIGAAGDLFNGFAKAVGNDLTAIGEAMRGNFAAAKEALNNAGQSLSAGWEKASARVRAAWDAASGGIDQSVSNTKTAFDDLFGTFSNVSAGAKTTATSIGGMHAPLVENAADAERMRKALASAEVEAAKFLTSLDGIGADKYTKALEQYNSQLEQADVIFNKLIVSGESTEKAIAFIAEATAKAKTGFDSLVQAMRNANDADAILAVSRANAESDLNEQIRLLGLDEQSREADALATKLVTQALGDLKDFVGPLTEDQQRLIDSNKQLADSFVKQKTNLDLAKQAAQEYASIWKSAGDSLADTFANILVNGGSLFDSLVNIAKQTVQQIIAYFAKLAVINPILNAIFGGSAGFSLLPTLASTGSSAGASILGGASGGTATAASNSGLFGTAQGGFSLFQGGKNLWEGFQSGWQSFFQGTDAYTMGPPTLGGSTSSYYGGGYTSGFGQALGIAGGVYAGYNRFQQAGGGLGGAAGGAAYGYGTYAAGAGIATLAATGSITAGLAAIGPIGWVAIGLMAIDTLSGGKLFGTKGKFNFGEQAITVGAGGATVTAGYDLKGQQALFGGSTHSWQSLAVDPAAQAAADAFFAQLKKGTEDFAKQFGVTMGDIVGGQFVATFDKHGNVTGTTSTVAGHTYSGETQEQFQERLVAENELSVLGQFDDKLAGAIDKYRSNADELYAITNDLATAQKGFNDGLTFLALGADQSTSALLALAEASQQMGETIDQALQRIMQAQAAYDQFVAQFKPATNYVDDFEKALSDINAQMLANIKQANDLARAAGAAGATEQDLANIHAYAAQQAAAALQALQTSAQSLAFDLGLTTVGSLDQVNSEIERLQAKANAGASAVHGFGSAMQDAADNAKHAMDLLLGDLSPLNDQQKLQKALEGLRAGTVTQEQVLEIGRRLYGSSQPYNALFAMVQQMGRTAQVGAGGAGGIGAQGGGGLTGAERERLNQLLKEQAGLQAAATLTQYQTLAQQIAEIASAQGVDWRTVVQNMGINIKDFEAGLKLNDQQTNDYITAIQSQTDDNGENTQSLIEALDRNTAALDRVSGYQSGQPGDIETMGTDGRSGVVAQRGHGRGRLLTPEDADMIGRSVAQHSRGMNGRSSRPPTAASTAR